MLELQKFDELQTNLTVFVAPVKGMKVGNQEESANASKTFRELTSFEKKVEEKRKELVAPLNDQVKRINEYAKQIVAPLADAKTHLSKELLAFERVLEEQRMLALIAEREERRKRDEEVALKLAQAKLEVEEKLKAAKEEAEMAAMFSQDDNAAIEAAKKAEEEAFLVKAQAEAEAKRVEFEAQKAHWDAKKEIASNKVDGTRRTWTFKILDLEKVPEEFKVTSVDEKKVKKFISGGGRILEGIEIYQELSMTAR
jgi:hypothetical protein